MRTPEIRRRDGRFEDPDIEAAYLDDGWVLKRLQVAATVGGLSAAMLLTLRSDVAYLRDTVYFEMTAGLRGAAALSGFALALGLLLLRPGWRARWVHWTVSGWIVLCLLAASVIACVYPAMETTPEGRADVLVFTSYWMSILLIVIGFGLSPYPRMVLLASVTFAGVYLTLAALYWTSAAFPMASQSVIVVSTATFGWIMAVVSNARTRRRFHITRLYEEAKTAAEQSQDFQAFVLAATGHDIRQPVYALDLNASALEQMAEAGDLKGVQRMARRQKLVARNVTGMLSSILQLSYLDAGKAVIDPERLKAESVLSKAIDTMSDLAREGGLAIRHVRSALPVRADAGVVGHILSNLVANAINHSGGTRLVCGARRRGTEVEFLIADDGRGLPAGVGAITSMAELRERERGGALRAGLGMEIMFRLAELGGLALSLRGRPGGGVVATLRVPRG